MQVRIAASAEADLLNGFRFYERQQAGVGNYFLDSVYADIDSLMLYAGLHPKPHGRLHRMLARRFPFAIYYDVQGEWATVVAVLDCRPNSSATDNMSFERDAPEAERPLLSLGVGGVCNASPTARDQSSKVADRYVKRRGREWTISAPRDSARLALLPVVRF